MSSRFSYVSQEDNQQYEIYSKYDEKKLTLYIEGNGHQFSSDYLLESLNEKFRKIIKFKTMDEFLNCLNLNLKNKTLILQAPYKNVITSKWKIFPNSNNSKIFSLISTESFDKSVISLIFNSSLDNSSNFVKEIEKIGGLKSINNYNNIVHYGHWLIENMIFLNKKYEDEKQRNEEYNKIVGEYVEENKKNLFTSVLIMFDYKNIVTDIINIIKNQFKNQIFIILLTDQKKRKLKMKLEEEINTLNEKFIRPYCDIENIYIHKNNSKGFEKAFFSLLQIYSYFNQLGDSFMKQIPELGLNIKNVEKYTSHLFHTHYFNILLCGRTGCGKSTFINKIMGEKKSFTAKAQSAGTYRNNFYIHKKYPIRIIDVCGLAKGNEGNENREKLKSIFNEKTNEIIIDEQINDIFSFYGDKRNNIHLLLYFNIYDDKYDILPGELPVMFEALEHKIPIIFIINRCENQLFEQKEIRELVMEEIKEVRNKENKQFVNFNTYFINCINKKGFNELLDGIYKEYTKYKIPPDILEKMKNEKIDKNELDGFIKKSFFFKDISAQDILLNESLINSVTDIIKLNFKLAAYYTGELKFFEKIGVYFFDKIYNNIKRDPDKNFFPLLTDLVKKIYQNFDCKKTDAECNNFIKKEISRYFCIELKDDKNKKEDNEEKKNFNEEKITENFEKEKSDKKNNEKENQNKTENNEKVENKEDEEDSLSDDETPGYEKPRLTTSPFISQNLEPSEVDIKQKRKCTVIQYTKNLPSNKKSDNTTQKGDDNAAPRGSMLDDYEFDEDEDETLNEGMRQSSMLFAPPPIYEFTMEQFQKDFLNLGKLFLNPYKNFRIKGKSQKSKDENILENKIFSFDEKNKISLERILLLVKRDFGLDHSKRMASKEEKIKIKLFYISYTCNQLISHLCGKINSKGFKYQSICNFFYTVSLSYNQAIDGFLKIKEEICENQSAPKAP